MSLNKQTKIGESSQTSENKNSVTTIVDVNHDSSFAKINNP